MWIMTKPVLQSKIQGCIWKVVPLYGSREMSPVYIREVVCFVSLSCCLYIQAWRFTQQRSSVSRHLAGIHWKVKLNNSILYHLLWVVVTLSNIVTLATIVLWETSCHHISSCNKHWNFANPCCRPNGLLIVSGCNESRGLVLPSLKNVSPDQEQDQMLYQYQSRIHGDELLGLTETKFAP